jgi:hypothetical protein
MHARALLFLLAVAVAAPAQEAPARPSSRPQAIVVITEHERTSANYVEVTMLAPGYPHDLLQRQVEEIGRQVGSAPRGLQVFSHVLEEDREDLAFVKATFAVDGLIEPETRDLRLQPVVRAFAGAPQPHRIDTLRVIFAGVRPTERAVRQFESEAVRIEGEQTQEPPGVEYHVQIHDQNPEAIRIPATLAEAAPPAPATPPRAGPDWTLIAVLAVAALAVGALVYSLLLRSSGSASRPKKDK